MVGVVFNDEQIACVRRLCLGFLAAGYDDEQAEHDDAVVRSVLQAAHEGLAFAPSD